MENFSVQKQRISNSWDGENSTKRKTQTKDTIKAGNIPVKGKEYPVGTISMTEGTTNPPGRYTEGTLIDQMDKKGLGTVATRADIIDKLFNSYLLEKKGNEIHITSKGKQLLELVPEDLKKAELTADWEKKLTAISKGKQNDQKFMREISDYTQALINDIKTSDGKFRHDNVTRHRCPECGKFFNWKSMENTEKRLSMSGPYLWI